MKRKSEAGFSLVEVLVSMVILGLTIVPMMSGMVVALKSIGMADEMMHAQLAVSSAVEELMAEGYPTNITPPEGVTIQADKEAATDPYYKVTVSSGGVTVTTYIRENVPEDAGGDGA